MGHEKEDGCLSLVSGFCSRGNCPSGYSLAKAVGFLQNMRNGRTVLMGNTILLSMPGWTEQHALHLADVRHVHHDLGRRGAWNPQAHDLLSPAGHKLFFLHRPLLQRPVHRQLPWTSPLPFNSALGNA